MRSEWLGGSAAALVVGSVALTLAFATTPLPQGQPVATSAANVQQQAGLWMTSSMGLFIASIGMTLGLPALLWLMSDRGPRLALAAVTVFGVGTIGMSGYAMILVFLRALLVEDQLVLDGLDEVTSEPGAQAMVGAWLGCFMLGLVMIAIGLWRARSAPRWVSVVLVVFVVSQALPLPGGNVGTVVQFAVLTVGLLGASMAANDAAHGLEQRAHGSRLAGPRG